MLFTCVVIDDDIFAVEQLEEYVTDHASLTLLKSFSNALTAVAAIKLFSQPVDILFTDVEMPGLTGLEVATLTKNHYKKLVLVSSHCGYAIDGYGVKANGFIPKPFSFDTFSSTVNRVIRESSTGEPTILVKKKKLNKNLKINEIVAVQTCANYLTIYTHTESYSRYATISEMEKLLNEYPEFIRISRFFIISDVCIKQIQGKIIILTNGLIIKVGKTYGESFQKINDMRAATALLNYPNFQ